MKNSAINLVKKGGEILKSFFDQDKKLLGVRGTVKEIVTKYDKLVDKMMIKEIKKKYPGHSILSEESGFLKGRSDWLWILDSLDGTGNFASGNPLFSISLALMKGKDILMGIVYLPITNQIYFAEKGKGAYLNNKKIQVSKIAKLSESYLFFCEGGEKNKKITQKIFNKFYSKVIDLRKIGSAGIETSWVASGRVEGFLTTKIEPWDVASGVLLVQEGGGKVTDFEGRPWQPKKSNLVFSNGRIHQTLLNILKN